jgi:hypothetical protein
MIEFLILLPFILFCFTICAKFYFTHIYNKHIWIYQQKSQEKGIWHNAFAAQWDETERQYTTMYFFNKDFFPFEIESKLQFFFHLWYIVYVNRWIMLNPTKYQKQFLLS